MNSLWPIVYCAKEAAANIRRHLWPSLVAVASIAALLFVAGVGAWAWMSFERLASGWQEKARLVVYLRDDAAPTQRETIAKTLEGHKEVEAVRFISKTEAMERMRKSLDGQQDILEGLEENPLPASYEVTVRPEARRVATLERVGASVRELPGVEDIEYGKPWLSKLDALNTVGRAAGLVGLLLISAALLLIVNNTSKLSLYARLEELELFKLVGASPLLVRGPYILEGAFKGLIGGALSGASLLLLQAVVEARYGADLRIVFGLWPSGGLAWTVAGGVAALGLALGLVGSANAARQVVRRLP